MKNPFEQFHNDIIKIISKDGSRTSDNLKANLTPGLIHLYDTNIDIEDGDFIERVLSNNRTENYIIIEATFKEKFMTIPAHYSLKVQKTTAIKPDSTIKNVYNISGNNTRVNHNSIDNSVNTVNQTSDEIFQEIRNFINQNIEFNSNLLAALSELEQNKGDNSYSNAYLKFVSIAADHIGLLAPFLPALAALHIK